MGHPLHIAASVSTFQRQSVSGAGRSSSESGGGVAGGSGSSSSDPLNGNIVGSLDHPAVVSTPASGPVPTPRRPSRDHTNGHSGPSQEGDGGGDGGEGGQRVQHRRKDSDPRAGQLRRQHTDQGLPTPRLSRGDMGRPSDPILTDFMPLAGEGAGGRGQLRRQASLDADLHDPSRSHPYQHPQPYQPHLHQHRRQNTDLDLRRAQLRSDLQQWRLTPPSTPTQVSRIHPPTPRPLTH